MTGSFSLEASLMFDLIPFCLSCKVSRICKFPGYPFLFIINFFVGLRIKDCESFYCFCSETVIVSNLYSSQPLESQLKKKNFFAKVFIDYNILNAEVFNSNNWKVGKVTDGYFLVRRHYFFGFDFFLKVFYLGRFVFFFFFFFDAIVLVLFS